MDSNTDLTLFWLAWQKTCSIRLCCVGHEREYRERCSGNQELCEKMELVQKLAQDVMKSMNSHFILRLGKANEEKGLRLSDYSSEAEAWKPGYAHGSAFELLEAHLYNKQFLSGKQFKAYLFENIADRPGGMSRNLFGYLQRVLRTIVRESYGENVYQPLQDEDGKDVEPARISLDGRTVVAATPTAEECAEAREVEDAFRIYLAECKDWDADHWLILYCILNILPVGGARIRPLFVKGHQTINVWASEMKSDLLRWLRERFSDKAIVMALDGRLQAILNLVVQKMDWYPSIVEILEQNCRSTGK